MACARGASWWRRANVDTRRDSTRVREASGGRACVARGRPRYPPIPLSLAGHSGRPRLCLRPQRRSAAKAAAAAVVARPLFASVLGAAPPVPTPPQWRRRRATSRRRVDPASFWAEAAAAAPMMERGLALLPSLRAASLFFSSSSSSPLSWSRAVLCVCVAAEPLGFARGCREIFFSCPRGYRTRHRDGGGDRSQRGTPKIPCRRSRAVKCDLREKRKSWTSARHRRSRRRRHCRP